MANPVMAFITNGNTSVNQTNVTLAVPRPFLALPNHASPYTERPAPLPLKYVKITERSRQLAATGTFQE